MNFRRSEVFISYRILTILLLTSTIASSDDLDDLDILDEDFDFSKLFSGGDFLSDSSKITDRFIDDLVNGAASTSLKFILTHYKLAVQTEKELDTLLDHEAFEDEEDRIKEQWKARSLTFKRLANRAQTLITKARQGKLSRSEVKDEILSIHKEKEKYNLDFDSLEANSTRFVEIQALEKQKQKMHEEVNKFANMKDEYAAHMILIKVSTKINLNDPDLMGFEGEFVEFDTEVLERLIKQYEAVEDLKVKIDEFPESETDTPERVALKNEIDIAENNIAKTIDDNNDMLGRFMPSTTGILLRSMEKLLKVDTLYKGLSRRMDDSNKEIQNQLKEMQNYNDIMDEAASVWFSLKNEL